ncbi:MULTISPECIES: hypothetical protein [unclassified Mesorhizobium]|uniref:hypothetical protein n=1 Tax=unclassified Mesorhizobium TaxID=325217 RepID=UPI001127F7DA|nr:MULTISPECIES: hypothetical protein [unclassified Mesorhizobium]MCA0027378.1 hypothetical protein [Mesorhizobium sp. B263B1A]TPJ98651.1 hypothetical protein FJ489_06905 [Mesorhizobium sp. B2-5-12]TPK28814.1 hypothetical protein FJ562_00295 [Mesorhizobium sp. B2-5-6]
MKKIRDAQTIIGMLEGGELAQALSGDITETLTKLKDLGEITGSKSTVKGKVVLTLDFEVKAGAVTVLAGIDTKVPKAPRGSSFYWITDDGSLSTEHPQQTDMFSGPRSAAERQ